MANEVYEDQVFEKTDFTGGTSGKEFLTCTFNGCNFENADLSGTDFFDCTFRNCNLSLAKMRSTGLKTVQFHGCKITGVDFSYCNDFLFAVSFYSCMLDYASFQKKKMKQTVFRDCSLKEAHFSNCDLTGAVFSGCDLTEVLFQDNNLEKADFSSARNFIINPAQNKMKKAKFSYSGLPGLLAHLQIEIE